MEDCHFEIKLICDGGAVLMRFESTVEAPFVWNSPFGHEIITPRGRLRAFRVVPEFERTDGTEVRTQLWRCSECWGEFWWHPAASTLTQPSECGICEAPAEKMTKVEG